MIAVGRRGRGREAGGSEKTAAEEEGHDGTRGPVALPRRRGRPARLSRELVVDAVVALLERAPDEALTTARIAREVGAVPAALYRHFESLDDILDSVLARVLATNESMLGENASWESQLANARASHDELSEQARARFAPILGAMKRLDGDALFAFVVEQVTTRIALHGSASQRS